MKNSRKLLALFLMILIAFSAVACQKADEPAKEPEETEIETEEPAKEEAAAEESAKETAEEAGDYYPVTITTYNYEKQPVEITFEKAPEKVVAVYQGAIENLLALGLEDHILAAAGLDIEVKDEWKDAFAKVNYLEERPSKEAILQMEPDFINSWYSLFGEKNLGDVDFWIDRGINTYMALNSGVIQPNSLENEYQDILNMGIIFNKQEEAQAIVDSMKTQIKTAKEYAKDKEPVKTAIVEVEKENSFRVYGEDSIGGNIATLAGAELVADKNGSIGAEELVSLNPEVIFTVFYGEAIQKDESVKLITDNEALKSIDAVKNNRVYAIMLSEVYASGVRTGDGIESILKGLYPDFDANAQ